MFYPKSSVSHTTRWAELAKHELTTFMIWVFISSSLLTCMPVKGFYWMSDYS